MKVTATMEEVYCLQFGSVKLPGLRVKSSWKDYCELVDAKGQVIIVANLRDRSGLGLMSDLLGLDKEREVVILQASPDILHKLKQEEEKAEAGPAAEVPTDQPT